MSKIKLVIFDLDGTLLDTIQDLANACNYALTQCSYPTHDVQAYKKFVGRGIFNLFRAALGSEASEENVARMHSFFVPYYNQHKEDNTRPYPGIEALLRALEERGVVLAVASNKYQEGTEKLVAKYFPERHFCAVLGQREGHPIKPDPAIVREAEQAYMQWRSGIAGDVAVSLLSSDEVLYVGDSNVDMQTGHNAEVLTAAVLWGFRDEAELAAGKPDLIASHPDDILNYVLSRR